MHPKNDVVPSEKGVSSVGKFVKIYQAIEFDLWLKDLG